MALAADQTFDMDFSGGTPSAPAQAPMPASNQGGAADQPFDMNFSGDRGSGSAPPASSAAPAPQAANTNDYYASLTSDYAERAKADAATRAAAVEPKGFSQSDLDAAAAHQRQRFTNDLAQAGQAYWKDLWAPGAEALKNVGQDLSAPIGTHNGMKAAGDIGALLASPVTGFVNAEVVQPGASLLDQLPRSQTLSLGANGKVQATTLTPAEQHAQNEQIIGDAMMALGPEGAEVGSAAKFAAAKNASNLASVVTKVPADVALDASGKLTDEGLEYAAKANVRPKDLEKAYKAVQEAREPAAAPEPQAAQPVPAQPTAAAPAEAVAPAAPTEAPAEAPQAEPQPPPAQQAVWRSAEGDHPVDVVGEPKTDANGRSFTPVRSQVHGGLGFVSTEELAPAATAADTAAASGVRVGPNGLTEFGERPEDVPTTPEARAAEAQKLGVNLTEGEATRDFSTQDAEERLRASDAPQSNAARQFRAQQQDNIANAVDSLKQAIGDPELTAEDRGQMVQDALRAMNENGLKGASAVYEEGRKLADALGEHGSNLMRLDTDDLSKAIKDILIDETVDPQARAALRQQAAQYGLIGGAPKVYEDGSAVVRLLDQEGKEGPAVNLPRAPEPLTIQNAEGFRQQANRIFRQFDEPRALEVKGVLDKAVGDAIERAASSDAGEFAKTMQKARALYRENRETFGAKDVVQDLIDWKVEGKTPKIAPDQAVARLLRGGKDSVTALKKVKAVLLSKPTDQSRAAWQAIKSQAVTQILERAKVVNAQGGAGAFSGAKLNSAVKAFGIDKLRVVLDENEFNQLMQLRRVVANATIPADHIVNASNSGNVLARFAMKHGNSVVGKALRSVPGIGHGLEAARDAAEIAKQHAEDQRTLNGILNYRPKPKS